MRSSGKKIVVVTMVIGELFKIARNELIDKWGFEGDTNEGQEAITTTWEYLLYGDPSWTQAK